MSEAVSPSLRPFLFRDGERESTYFLRLPVLLNLASSRYSIEQPKSLFPHFPLPGFALGWATKPVALVHLEPEKKK